MSIKRNNVAGNDGVVPNDMEYWHEVWERKGRVGTEDLWLLNGYEATSLDPEEAAKRIIDIMKIKKTDNVLEVGCGAGMLAKHLDCNYVGVDYSKSLVAKHINLLGNSVLHGFADNLMFKDNSFDKVFAYGVFFYFPSKAYALKAVSEIIRVAREAVFIGDLPVKSHRDEHLLFTREEFDGWSLSEGFYYEDRFNAFMKL